MRRLLLAVLVLAIGDCGYFNSLYNANRRFAEAERAHRRGDATAASRAYTDAIDKAAVSYRRYPDSRWADDALLLMGRARFALRNDRATIAAMRVVLDKSVDADVRAAAHAYLGAALLRSDSAGARAYLDSAATRLSPASDIGALARLWRARARFDSGEAEAAFADLEPVFANRAHAFDAAIVAASHAATLQDAPRFEHAIERLAATGFEGQDANPVTDLLARSAAAWSAAGVFAASGALDRASWRADLVDAVALARADLALEAGDSAAALALATRVAAQAAPGTGDGARLMAARLRLRTATDPDELEQVRQFLLPAYADAAALLLQRQVKAVQILMLRGSEPASALSLFAAAEMLRDDVGAPLLARRLFLDYAALVPDAPWSGKALLAAHLIHPDDTTAAALRAAAANPYVLAASDPARASGIGLAEERLARGLAGVQADALAEAVVRDVIVGRAVTILDSTRTAARSDSIRIACGTLLDSLHVAGIRADSARSACLRGDSTRVAFVLRVDTTALVDTAAIRAGRSENMAVRPVRPDTIPARH